MNLYRDSMLYRSYRLHAGTGYHWNRIPDNVCEFWRKYLLYQFRFSLIVSLAVFVLTSVIFTGAIMAQGLLVADQENLWVGVGFFSILVLSVIAFVALSFAILEGLKYLTMKALDAIPTPSIDENAPRKPRQESMFIQWIKDKHNKICTRIEVKDR